ncbi:hypothetical protein O181_010577 [Austropuccinia psidii MF-1]|uniref:Uncharacterized protein n=1 Tax=Austropuccinia psidii MF-1 TaxID=1389203 RepID=A0A9Q3GLB9_9BASI|nr:hypothetical protein [Austropuccinia psidii MF-1]
MPSTILMLLQCPQNETTMPPPSPPSPILMPPHPHHLQSLRSLSILKICCKPALNPPYTSSHPPNPLHPFLSLHLCSALPTCLQFRPHTGLILNSAYHPYAPEVPSRWNYNASSPSPPSPLPHLLPPYIP